MARTKTELMVGDKVAVVKQHERVAGKYVAFSGTLTELDRGLPKDPEDKRTKGCEGDCPLEVTVDNPGWAVITVDGGRRVSVRAREMKLDSQALQAMHVATMAQVAKLDEEARVHAEEVARVTKVVEGAGFDLEGLTENNLFKIAALLSGRQAA